MKPSVSAAALISAVAFSAPARDFRPDMSFENVPAGDESIQQCLVFPTTPGVGYRVEWSHDLTDWTTDEEVYGLGFDFVVAMREFTPPPPPPEPGSGDPPPVVTTPSLRASLVLREVSGETPGIVVSWKSLDHGGPMKRFLPLVMTENWSQMPFYWRTFDDCDFFITALGNPVEPPDPDAPMGLKDTEMISCLEDHFAEINAEIDASAARARNTPPPAPPDPQAKKFWRVHCDAGIDTDGDGSPDWAEFEISGSSNGVMVAGVSADAFAADTNGDGIPDGEQLDVDGDGTADAVDTDLEDAAVSYAVGQLPRYALFPITNAEPPAPYRTPIEVNDRGEVLYANGIWQGGVWTPLPGYAATSSSSVMAFQMNDLGEVVGIVNGDFEHEGGTVLASYDMPGNVVHWPDKETWCSPVVDGDRWAWLGSPLLTYPGLPQIQLSNDGRIIAAANYFETEDGIRSLEWDGNHLWTLAGPGRTAGRSPCAFYEGARSGPPRCGDTNGSWTRTVASPSNAS